jgi:hypothetical protein
LKKLKTKTKKVSRYKTVRQASYWEEAMEPFFQGLMSKDELKQLQLEIADQIVVELKTMHQDVDLRSELIEFLEASNWLNLEDRENATRIVDCYLDAFKGIDNDD